VIDIWATREDWERFRAVRDEIVDSAILGPATLRELNAIAMVRGER
jgi:hypothetical protein